MNSFQQVGAMPYPKIKIWSNEVNGSEEIHTGLKFIKYHNTDRNTASRKLSLNNEEITAESKTQSGHVHPHAVAGRGKPALAAAQKQFLQVRWPEHGAVRRLPDFNRHDFICGFEYHRDCDRAVRYAGQVVMRYPCSALGCPHGRNGLLISIRSLPSESYATHWGKA